MEGGYQQGPGGYLQPHRQMPQPTTSDQRASAISSMGPDVFAGAAPRPVYYGYAYPAQQQPYVAPQHVPPQQQAYIPQQQHYVQQPYPAQQQFPVQYQQPIVYAARPQQQARAPPAAAAQAEYQAPPPPQAAPPPPAAPPQQPIPASLQHLIPTAPQAQKGPGALDWSLDGLEFNNGGGGPAPPQPQQAQAEAGEVNDWPAPENMDPNVWSHLPEEMQRELLMQHAMEERGTEQYTPPPVGGSVRAANPARHQASDGENMSVEVLARVSARALHTKAWKPVVAVVKSRRELLIFRSAVDYAQYNSANVHQANDADLVQALKNMRALVKLQVRLGPDINCTPIKAKDYKGFGQLHHFTLEDGKNTTLAKFASKTEQPLFQLRNAITAGARIARGLPGAPELAQGRYDG